MTDINNKVNIQVNKDQGLISAIKTKLNDENINTSNITWNIWTKILEQVKNENEQNQANNKELIYHKGSDINGSGKENFVIFQGVITFSRNLWNNICKLARGEKLTQEPVTMSDPLNFDNSDDIALQNKTNANSAIKIVRDNINNIELPTEIDRSNINTILIKLAQQEPPSFLNIISVESMTANLLTVLLSEIMSGHTKEEINYYVVKNTAKFVPNGTLMGKKCSDLANNDALIKELAKNAATRQEQSISAQPIRFSEEQLKTKINNIKTKLNEVLIGHTFNAPNGKTVKGEDLLNILDNIKFKSENYGAARADKNNSEIIINLNGFYSSHSDAEIIKILIHEALHCLYKDTAMNTWEEEKLCESQAIALTARIVQNEKSNPNTTFTSFSVQGHNIEEFANNPQLLGSVIDTWLERAYANRVQNEQGDISILKDTALTSQYAIQNASNDYLNPDNRIEIKNGDEIIINGNKVTTIGIAILESCNLTQENGNSNTMSLLIPSKMENIGIVVFDECIDNTGTRHPSGEALPIEIIRNGKLICSGKIYPPQNMN